MLVAHFLLLAALWLVALPVLDLADSGIVLVAVAIDEGRTTPASGGMRRTWV